MQFWQSTAFNDPLELPEIAREAERLGFSGLLVSEHLMVPAKFKPDYLYSEDGQPPFTVETPFPDPWVCLAAMAAVTTRIRFCTLVHILPLHHPLEVAKSLATLALYSNNRVVLGAGAGWMKEEFEILGVDFASRGRRFNEMIEVMRLLWQGGPVEYHGEFFDFPAIVQNPAPSKPVPIAIGGASNAALKRAARLGDGWCGAGNSPEEAEEILRKLASLREEAGRENEPFEAIVPLTTEPNPDVLKHLSDLGATGTVSYPFSYTVGPDATLEQKFDAMKQFAEYVIEPCKDL
ncbi:MAG: LLM class F420-dependent oxidoreductase [Myxococcota bacterium]|nr:LLM class F420-dependent oxidoreductase [Myxococcota bacterium]